MRFLATLFTLLASVLTPAWAQNASFPPSPKQLVAVNPVTNKVYVANEFANTVTVLDQTNNTTATIPVGNRPQFIVVNPLTNRIFVNNGGEASLTVIDGATDANLTPTPLQIGSQGPMAINNETNILYVVRMSSVATDEVTFVNASNNTWYSIATESFQPTALTISPNTNTLYVAHYGTGDVRVISGEFNNTVLHPATFSIGAWSKPFAIAANSMTNKIYVITEDSRGPIGVIDGATRNAVWPTPAAGHASGPKALAVNPVTNKIYAAFANEVVVIDGGNNSLAYVPVPTGSVASIAINYFTNKVYVSSDGGNLTVIDGFTNATTALTVPGGTISIGMNPMTNEIITGGSTAAAVDGVAAPFIGLPLTTTITPLPGNSGSTSGSITMSATNGFPNPLPVRGVYYQFDSIEGRWSLASGAGNGPWTAALAGLSSGSHTIYAFAAEAHMAPTDTGNGSSPMFGNIASYAFTVTGAAGTATVGVTSSVNPSTSGQSVTFTATVTGGSGTPTGTVTFLDGSTPLCSAVALTSGSATCTTSALAAGSRIINANYSGNSSYGAASGSVTQTVNKLSATVALGSTPNPSTSGQSVTITATVTGSGGAPTGTVTFLDGTTTLCSAVALASGSATCTTSSLSTGAHTLNANYSGNATYNTASGTSTHNVGTSTATVGVSSSTNPSNLGQSVTFTASVTGSGATPTGTVTFLDGTTTLCSAVALASGSATCTTSALTAGSHTINANYSGNSAYGTASGSVSQTVNKLTATVTLGSTPNPSTAGQSVTITATVAGTGGTPTGTVTFLDGTTTLCSAVALASGSATCTTSSLSTGAHTLNANYSGNATYNTASGTATQNVGTATATVAVTSSVNPSTAGQSVTFTAAVSGGNGTPTGTVTFSDGATTLCSAVALASGSAACTTSALAAGSHTITAAYSGSTIYGAKSATVTQVVNKLAATVSLGSSPNPSTPGQSVTITANVSGSGGTATGTVTFTDGATTLCSAVSLVSGSATCTTSSLSSGSHTLNASYSGSATYNTATGTSTHNVGLATATVGVVSSMNPSNTGDSVTFTATVGGTSGTPTGTVTFSDGATTLCSGVSLASGTAMCTTSSLAAGGHTITAAYSGNATYGAKSASVPQTVNTAAPTTAKSEITSPAPGSTLSGPSVTFAWTAGSGMTARYLIVGTTPGGQDLFSNHVGSQLSQTVSGIPTDGRTIYLELSSYINGTWQTASASYTAAGGGPQQPPATAMSTITSPAPGSTLSGSSTTFSWTAGSGMAARYLIVGTTPGGQDLFSNYVNDVLSQTVSGIPTDGRTIYVQLSSYINGAWQTQSATYTAASGGSQPPPAGTMSVITSPASGSTLAGSSVTFSWTAGSGMTARYLIVGSTPGGQDLFSNHVGSALSQTVSGIPRDGRTIYVQLSSYINGTWQTSSTSYRAAGP